jgi:hypothetical protein
MAICKKSATHIFSLLFGIIILSLTTAIVPANATNFSVSNFEDSYYYFGRTDKTFYADAFDMSKLSGWTLAKTAIGFGSPAGGTGLLLTTTIPTGTASNQRGNPLHTWTYFKKTFELPSGFDTGTINDVSGKHRIDDMLVIYINGIEVYRYNTSSTVGNVNIGTTIDWGAYAGLNTDAVDRDFSINRDYNQRDTGYKSISTGSPNLFDAGSLTNLKRALKPGTNVITCVVGQNRKDSSDLWFNLSLNIGCGAGSFSAEMLTLTPGTNERAVNFTWYGDRDKSTASVVQIAKKSHMTNGEFPAAYAIIKEGTYGNASNGKNWHKVYVTGLEGNTEYIYRVSYDKNIYSQVYEYKTGASGSFHFVAVGDPQLTTSSTYKAGWANTVDKIRIHFPDTRFIMSTGDQIDSTSGNETEYTNLFAPAALRSLPLAPAMGNHDRHDYFNYHYNLPNETPHNQCSSEFEFCGNYWYSYNNTLFVVLNTCPDNAYSYRVEHHDATLAAAKALNPDVKWLFVMHHKSTASPGPRYNDASVIGWANALEPLMDKYQADFVVAGHDHVYSRSWSIYDRKKVEGINYGAGTVTNPQGTIYFTLSSSSGSKYYDLSAKPWPWYTNIAIAINVPQFTAIEVSSSGVTFTTYRTDNMVVLDRYTVIKDTVQYSVAAASMQNGTVTPSKTKATAGEVITLNVSPDSGYMLVAGSLKYNNITIVGNSFIMPAANVTITASFVRDNSVPITYKASSFGDSYYYYGRTDKTFYTDAFDMSKLSGWTLAKTAIGFGSPASGTGLSLATTIPTGTANVQRGNPLHAWTYFKKTFELPSGFDANTIKDVSGKHRIDDVLVIYINGIEVYRYNTSTTSSSVNIGTTIDWDAYKGLNTDAVNRDFSINSDYNQRDTGYKSISSGAPNLFDAGSLTNLKRALKPGTNVITCVVGQNRSDSSDLWFDLQMDITLP